MGMLDWLLRSRRAAKRRNLVIRPVGNEVEAQEARVLLTKQIAHPSDVPFPERVVEDDDLLRPTLIGAWADDSLVGAAFIGPDIQEANSAGLVAGKHAREFFIRNVAMIHGVAVSVDHRHEGVGTQIKRYLDAWAADHHAFLVLSVATTDFARAMNEKAGHVVLPPQVTLRIQVIDHITGEGFDIGFPFRDDEGYDSSWAWGAVAQPAGFAVRIAEVDPPAAAVGGHERRRAGE
jgi:GNAT superfamily N-acetyltransferase